MKINYTNYYNYNFTPHPLFYDRAPQIAAEPFVAAAASPSQRFIDAHSIQHINAALNQYRMNYKDLALFKTIIANEGEGFLGYQAGSSTVRLFQDMLHTIVKEILQIPIPDDFVFLRVPGDATFKYDTAESFLREKGLDIQLSGDNSPAIRQHILSLNMALYQSYDAPWDLTPRYYLENTTWTHANVREIIKPFFASLGIDSESVDQLWDQALNLLSHNRGYIIQFFDSSDHYDFARQHSYIAYSGGNPHPRNTHHEILFDPFASNFPQMRLVMSNQSTLNPFSQIKMKRYDGMTSSERARYESALSTLLEKLPFDPNRVKKVKENILNLWTPIP
jgi:hypothetical protein